MGICSSRKAAISPDEVILTPISVSFRHIKRLSSNNGSGSDKKKNKIFSRTNNKTIFIEPRRL